MKRVTMAVLALGMLAGPSAASAQGSASGQIATDGAKGFMLGAHTFIAPGVTIEGTGDTEGELETELGGGIGLRVGYGFTPMFAVYLGADLARQDSGVEDIDGNFGLAHLEIGGRASFPLAGQRVMPYVTAAVGGRAVGAEVEDEDGDTFDMSLSGKMLSLGGGVQYFVSPKLAIDGGLTVGFGKFGSYEEDGDDEDIDADNTTAIRMRVGVSWYPVRGRGTR